MAALALSKIDVQSKSAPARRLRALPTPPEPVVFASPRAHQIFSVLDRQVIALDYKFQAGGRHTHATLRSHARMLGCTVAQLRYSIRKLTDAGLLSSMWDLTWVQKFETRAQHGNLRKANCRTFVVLNCDPHGRLLMPDWLSAWVDERLAVKARHGGARRGAGRPPETPKPVEPMADPTLSYIPVGDAPASVTEAPARAEITPKLRPVTPRKLPSKCSVFFQVSQPNERTLSFLNTESSSLLPSAKALNLQLGFAEQEFLIETQHNPDQPTHGTPNKNANRPGQIIRATRATARRTPPKNSSLTIRAANDTRPALPPQRATANGCPKLWWEITLRDLFEPEETFPF
jgi:hypothetical protein